MNIVFRVDSSTQIGTGHAMRCLTLAKELKKNFNVQFICRDREGCLIGKIQSEGFKTYVLPKVDEKSFFSNLGWLGTTEEIDASESARILKKIKPDWLIIDHYGIGKNWHKSLSQFAKKILVIDDLANRQYQCDILLDQNFYNDSNKRYNNLVSHNCMLLLGPKYALLREEFKNRSFQSFKSDINQIMIYFGGSDLRNNTLKALQGIQLSQIQDVKVNVITNPGSPYLNKIKKFSSKYNNIICFDFVDNMAEMMENSDLYIGSAGTTTWERCCMGLPSIVIGVAENQMEPMEAMKKAEMTFFLGSDKSVTNSQISDLLNTIFNDTSVLKKMRKKNLKLVDGLGASRCVSAMLSI